MAHGLTQTDTMISVRETPWHGLGTVYDKPPTFIKAIEAAGLDYPVEKKALFTVRQADTQGSTYTLEDEAPAMAVVRTDTDEILSVVSPRYTVVENKAAFKPFEPLFKDGSLNIETAGTLFNGRRAWMLGKMQGDNITVVGDDEIKRYVLLANSFDGRFAIHVGFTPVRVVCNNTLSFAVNNGADKQLIKLWHKSNAHIRLEELAAGMDLANQCFIEVAKDYKTMAKKKLNGGALDDYIDAATKTIVQAKEGNTSKIKDRVIQLFETGAGNDMPKVRGTLWAAYNAVTEYVTHELGDAPDKRLDNLFFERGKRAITHAHIAAMRLAA